MAIRPVFLVKEKAPFFEKLNVKFQYFPGFAFSQKQRNIVSLHGSFLASEKNKKILEISSKSQNTLGIKLSAFNLCGQTDGKIASVECMFQASKKFQNGGPFLDILEKSSSEAKKDLRLKNNGQLVGFCFEAENFPLNPQTIFYDWLYSRTLCYYNENLIKFLIEYDAFSDIEFNPKKSLNCQAEAVAIVVSLYRTNLLDDAMKNFKSFSKIVFSNEKD